MNENYVNQKAVQTAERRKNYLFDNMNEEVAEKLKGMTEKEEEI